MNEQITNIQLIVLHTVFQLFPATRCSCCLSAWFFSACKFRHFVNRLIIKKYALNRKTQQDIKGRKMALKIDEVASETWWHC